MRLHELLIAVRVIRPRLSTLQMVLQFRKGDPRVLQLVNPLPKGIRELVVFMDKHVDALLKLVDLG